MNIFVQPFSSSGISSSVFWRGREAKREALALEEVSRPWDWKR
jgi:hypothetical protein